MENKQEIHFKEYAIQSWHIEFLIMSGVIFSLLNIPKSLLLQIIETQSTSSDESGAVITILAGIILISRVLLIGFITSLIIRVLWVCQITLNLYYPEGINYGKLNYSEYFEFKTKNTSLSNQSNLFDKYSRLFFLIAIYISIKLIGIFLFLWILLKYILDFFVNENFYYTESFIYILFLVLCLLSFGLLDNLIFNRLKRIKFIQPPYYFFYKFYNYFSLRFIVQNQWINLVSNVKRIKIHGLSLLMVAISFLLAIDYIGLLDLSSKFDFDDRYLFKIGNNSTINNSNYEENLKSNDVIQFASIPSEIIESSSLPIFLNYSIETDSILKQELDATIHKGSYYELNRIQLKVNSNNIQKSLRANIRIRIDTTEIVPELWYFKKHQITEQLGLHTIINIQDIGNGWNQLEISFRKSDKRKLVETIPFWKNNTAHNNR